MTFRYGKMFRCRCEKIATRSSERLRTRFGRESVEGDSEAIGRCANLLCPLAANVD
jgi:hypothetical protein